LYDLANAWGEYIPAPDDIGRFLQLAYKNMLPVIRPRLSLLNSIIELKDLKSLPRTLGRIASIGTHHAGTLKTILRSWANVKKSGSRGVRTVADSYLQTQFNIQPLLSDIAGLYRAILQTEAQMYRLLSEAARPQRKYFKYTFDEIRPESYEHLNYYQTPDFNWPWFDSICTFQTRPQQSVFNAEIEYNYYYPQFMREHARVLAFLDALGVNFNPAIIWNAIPWTFVVDWVIGVSQWLDQFKTSLFEPVINIRRCCWSVKRSRYIDAQFSVAHNHHLLHYTKATMPVITEVAYRRQVMMPTLSSLSTSGLNIKEFSLGVALAFSRPRRRHRS
jgi:hypothetical protein